MSSLVENLLNRHEGILIDFKKEQYKFCKTNGLKPTKHEKSELLKNILAFSDTERENNAYILTGIEEIKGQ